MNAFRRLNAYTLSESPPAVHQKEETFLSVSLRTSLTEGIEERGAGTNIKRRLGEQRRYMVIAPGAKFKTAGVPRRCACRFSETPYTPA